MRVVHTDRHRLRAPRTELSGGALVTPVDRPERVDRILARLAETGFGDIVGPQGDGLGPARRVHHPDYLAFLAVAWDDWVAAGHAGEAMPSVWPSRRLWRTAAPQAIGGRLGRYALAGETAISAGTWEAALAAAAVAATAAEAVAAGEPAAFALCRPPGHHAAQDMYGGYCFLNNAAIAAQTLLDRGAARVAALDVDFHHGNGTQAIFWDRGDVLFASIHGDPALAFPYFLGGADETGVGPGAGLTANYPLPPGAGWADWSAALEAACGRIAAFAAEALVVSLGVDACRGDPMGFFRLAPADFTSIGARLARLGLPTVFAMEGGYDLGAIGEAVVNALSGFEEG